MRRYSPLSKHLQEMLEEIEPSRDGDMQYFPCQVHLGNGKIVDTVYIESDDMYIKTWTVYPEEDKGKKSIPIDNVVKIVESPTRLPARFASEVYSGGEARMGIFIFTVLFSDGIRQAYVSGSAIDFIVYPHGKGPQDVVGVMPHEGGNNIVGCLQWYWCLYSGKTD